MGAAGRGRGYRREASLGALTSTTPVHSALLESLINPLQERIEDWKKSVNQLDKDHAKGGAGVSAGASHHHPMETLVIALLSPCRVQTSPA